MKRLLLATFLLVSCAGPPQTEWTTVRTGDLVMGIDVTQSSMGRHSPQSQTSQSPHSTLQHGSATACSAWAESPETKIQPITIIAVIHRVVVVFIVGPPSRAESPVALTLQQPPCQAPYSCDCASPYPTRAPRTLYSQ